MNYLDIVNNSIYLRLSILDIIIFLILLLIIFTIFFSKISQNRLIQHDFISIIAHKFRTPLTQVKWLIETVLKNETDPYKIKNLNDIKSSNEKLISLMGILIGLTNDVNENSKTYNLESTVIYDFVHDVSEELRPQFQEKNISIFVQSDDKNLNTKIDKIAMKFVLQTILNNSIIYSHPGQQVNVKIYKHWKKIIIDVIDNGIGIEPQNIKKVFAKFYRSENAERMDTEGFGVNLFISKTIMRNNKGDIKVYSEGTNKGSIFRIIL